MHHTQFHIGARSSRRSGLVAVKEIVIMMGFLAGVLWLLANFVTTVGDQPSAAKSASEFATVRGVTRISLACDGKRLWIYRPLDGLVQIDLATDEVLASVPLFGERLSAVAHSRDGTSSMLCSYDGNILLIRHNGEPPLTTRLTRSGEAVVDARMTPDGSMAVCVTNRGRIHGWSEQDGRFAEFQYDLPPGGKAVKLGLGETGQRMSIGRIDGTVSILEPVSGVPAGPELSLGASNLYAWSDDERLVAAANESGGIRVCDVRTGALVANVPWGSASSWNFPAALALSPDGRRLAATTVATTEIRVWDIETGALLSELRGHKGIVRALLFASADRLYSGSYDGEIRKWSLPQL